MDGTQEGSLGLKGNTRDEFGDRGIIEHSTGLPPAVAELLARSPWALSIVQFCLGGTATLSSTPLGTAATLVQRPVQNAPGAIALPVERGRRRNDGLHLSRVGE